MAWLLKSWDVVNVKDNYFLKYLTFVGTTFFVAVLTQLIKLTDTILLGVNEALWVVLIFGGATLALEFLRRIYVNFRNKHIQRFERINKNLDECGQKLVTTKDIITRVQKRATNLLPKYNMQRKMIDFEKQYSQMQEKYAETERSILLLDEKTSSQTKVKLIFKKVTLLNKGFYEFEQELLKFEQQILDFEGNILDTHHNKLKTQHKTDLETQQNITTLTNSQDRQLKAHRRASIQN